MAVKALIKRAIMLTLAMGTLTECSQPSRCKVGHADEDTTMKSSVTWLHLLRHTPFFTSLNTEQLRWVINHSCEWEARKGTFIAGAESGKPVSDDIWVLLDGGWQVEASGKVFPAGHADPGKWYSATDAAFPGRLVTTGKSYVMRISRSDMQEMLSMGFAFNNHMESGKQYYKVLSGQLSRSNHLTPN